MSELSQQMTELHSKTDKMSTSKKLKKKGTAAVAKKGKKGKMGGKDTNATKVAKTLLKDNMGLNLQSPAHAQQNTLTTNLGSALKRRISLAQNQ